MKLHREVYEIQEDEEALDPINIFLYQDRQNPDIDLIT
jgi:hypothetical protein